MDFYHHENIDLTKLDINTDNIEDDITASLEKDNKGLTLLTNHYIEGMFETSSVQNLLEDMDEEEKAELIKSSAFSSISPNNIQVSAKVYMDGNNPYVLLTIKVVDITIALGKDDNGKARGEMKLSFVVKEQVAASVGVTAIELGAFKYYLHNEITVKNYFKLVASASLSTGTTSSNITAELKEIFNKDTPSETGVMWADEINSSGLLSSDLNYVPIVEKEFLNKTITIEIFSLQFKITGVIGVGAEGAIGTNLMALSTSRSVSTNGYTSYNNGKVEYHINSNKKMVNYRDVTQDEFIYQISLKGKIGVRAGVVLEANISLFRLNDMYNIGVTFELGVYAELMGFVHIAYNSAAYSPTINGGIMFEAGVYLEVAFAWKCWPTDGGSITLYEKKFPIVTFSTLDATLGFKNDTGTKGEDFIILKDKTFDLFNSEENITTITSLKFNFDNGYIEVVDNKATSDNIHFYYELSNDRMFTIKNGIITMNDNAYNGYTFALTIYNVKPTDKPNHYSVLFFKKVNFMYQKKNETPVDRVISTIDVTFDSGKGIMYAPLSTTKTTIEATSGEPITFDYIPESYVDGNYNYVFDHWQGFVSGETSYEFDTTVVAVYKKQNINYTVTFDANYGSFKDEVITSVKGERGLPITSPTPTRNGYDFVGWSTEKNGSVNITFGNNGKLLDKDYTVYAIWKEKETDEITITFDAGEGYFTPGKKIQTFKIKKGDTVPYVPFVTYSPNDALDYYYELESWSDNFEMGVTTFTKNQTFTAQYVKVDRSFDIIISNYDYIFSSNGSNTNYEKGENDSITIDTEDDWIDGSFSDSFTLNDTATLTLSDGRTFTTNKYAIIYEEVLSEDSGLIPRSIDINSVSTFKNQHNLSFNTINLNLRSRNINAIVTDSSSRLTFGALLSYYYNSNGLDLSNARYISAAAYPIFEVQ